MGIKDKISSLMQNLKSRVCNIWVFSVVSLFLLTGNYGVSKESDAGPAIEEFVFDTSNQEKLEMLIAEMGLKRTNESYYSKASWYGGEQFHGKKTASNESFDQNLFTAAHKTLPMNTYVLVTNLHNNKTLIVKINDRGPFIQGRDIDLSESAAASLEAKSAGIIPIKYEVLGAG